MNNHRLAWFLFNLKTFKDWRTPIEFTLVGLSIVVLEDWVLFTFTQYSSQVWRTSIGIYPYRCNFKFAFVRVTEWARKPLKQSKDNRQAAVPVPWSHCGFAHERLISNSAVKCNTSIFRIMKQLQQIFSTRNIWNKCLIFFVDTVWMSICLCAKGLVWMGIISIGFKC